MITVPLNIVLHDNQRVIHESKARNKVVRAGKRFGKTKWLLYALAQAAAKRSNQVIWYLAPTYRQAKNIAWQELQWMIPRQVIRRSVENELMKEFVNGSILKLVGTDNEEATRGTKLHGVGYDEAAYIDPYIHEGIISGQLLGGEESGFAYFISSPNKVGMNWFTAFWDRAKQRMGDGDKDWAAFHYTIYDNPTLNREDIEKLRANTTDDTWDLEYMAKESPHAGIIYNEFSYANHVKVCDSVNGWLLVRGLDWGISHPTACVWAWVSPSLKRIHIYQEFMRSDLLIHESCAAINKMTGENTVDWSVIDPSTSKRNSQTGRRDMDEFVRNGVGVVPGDNKDRGYDITKMMFKKNVITIDPKCKNLILQLKQVQYGDKVNDDMCLVAGTKITCEDGYKNIEDVQIGDKVLTRGGYQQVIMSERTNLTDVVKINTSNGKEIIGTLNHPIFMKDGSVKELGKIEVGDRLFDVRCYCLIQSGIWKLKSLLKPVKNLTDFVTTGWVASISRNATKMVLEVYCCIVKYGSIITGTLTEPFRYITKITTNAITDFQILKPCPNPNTWPSTCEVQSEESNQERILLNTLFLRQGIGMGVRTAENGMLSRTKKHGLIKNGSIEVVTFAGGVIKHLFQAVLSSVTLIAKWLHFGHVAVVSVTFLPTKHFVYNLSIENNSEYIANGLLSHNTDCLRYLCVRIHDFVFKWNDASLVSGEDPLPEGVYNLNDRNLFKGREVYDRKYMEEVRNY